MHQKPFNWFSIAVCLIVLYAVGLHLFLGWKIWGSDLADADAPAHFTSGVMVLDYLRHGPLLHPLAFAESFYNRFPKVAIGHWPPVYYALQALWYFVFGPTVAASRFLSIVITFAASLVLFRRVRALHGASVGALCAACFLCLPLVQVHSWLVMSDLLVGLFMFLAAMSFSDFLDSPKPAHAIWFIAWSVLAILTKGSAWSLGIFALAAPLVARKFDCFFRPWYWIAGILIVLLSAPFFLITAALHIGYPSDPVGLASGSVSMVTRLQIVLPFAGAVPLSIFIAGLAGLGLGLRNGLRTIEAVALTLIFAQLVFLFVLPLTEETRYYTPTFACILLFVARSMTATTQRFVPVLIAVGCLIACGLFEPARIDGYRAVIDSIPYQPDPVTILIGSDSSGEGALIAARLERDRARAGLLLRGSKVLAHSNWAGSTYSLVFRQVAEVHRYLHSVPVRYIVIDSAAARSPHLELLDSAMRSAPEIFSLRGRFPISGARTGEALVYENRQPGR